MFVEPICLTEIRKAKDAYTDGGLRERMARHHRDPDAAFYGWNDVWLHRRFPEWDITAEVANVACPLLLIQGERDQYGTMAQLDAIERAAQGPVPASTWTACTRLPIDLPVQTVTAITEFVRRLPRGGSAPPPAARTRR